MSRLHISIHAPRRRSDLAFRYKSRRKKLFQSTLPAGGATISPTLNVVLIEDFNPRSPQGERPGIQLCPLICINFNPRSPQGERLAYTYNKTFYPKFQSTLPAGGATCDCRNTNNDGGISIHAPRRGSDKSVKLCANSAPNFNPRSPQGERLFSDCSNI